MTYYVQAPFKIKWVTDSSGNNNKAGWRMTWKPIDEAGCSAPAVHPVTNNKVWEGAKCALNRRLAAIAALAKATGSSSDMSASSSGPSGGASAAYMA